MFWNKAKRYYLDYAASTPVSAGVLSAMKPYWSDDFANPNSIHSSGQRVNKVLIDCEDQIKDICNMTRDDYVLWTSGGTESNHIAIDCAVKQWKKNNPDQSYTVVISAIEHSSVLDYLESKDDPLLHIEHVPVDSQGYIESGYLETRFPKLVNVALVSCIFQSSEVGTTQPIKEISRATRNSHPEAVIHTDASQGMMYHRCNFQDWGVDMTTLCGQKIHGPKGSGILLCKKNAEAETLYQQGTPVVPLIVGITQALRDAQESIDVTKQRIVDLRSLLFAELNSLGVDLRINGVDTEYSLIINISFNQDERDSEQLVVAFDQAGLEVSSKSACMGSQAEDSRVLSAMGLSPRNSIRICLHHSLREKDIGVITKRIKQIIHNE